MAKLGDFCTKQSSNIRQSDLDSRDGSYPIYGASGFIKTVDFYEQTKPYIAVVKDGAGIGRVMKLPAYSSVIGTMQYIIPNDGVDVGYLAYAMEYMKLEKYYSGATIPHIYFKDYCKETMKEVSVEEQKQIVYALDLITSLISLRKKQLQKLDDLVKSRFVELFGDPAQNTMGLPVKTLPEISDNLDSRRIPITSSDRKAGVFPYYGASGIVDYVENYIFDEDILLVSEDGANLLARVTPIAFSVSGKVWVNNHAHVIRFTDKAMQIYVEHLLNMIDISSFVTGTAQPKLNQAKMNSIPIPMPMERSLQAFLEFVKQNEKTKLTVQQGLDKLELLKQSLMQKYFG